MIAHTFTPWSALLGGALIGLAASAMLLFNGRIAGVSGVLSGVLRPRAGDFAWRAAFVAGLVLAGLAFAVSQPTLIASTPFRSITATAIAGVVVGFGVRMGNGCASGHGVCGLSRMSRRSVVATLTFMSTGIATASLIQYFAGGQL